MPIDNDAFLCYILISLGAVGYVVWSAFQSLN